MSEPVIPGGADVEEEGEHGGIWVGTGVGK